MSVQVGHVSIEYYPPLDSIVSEFVKELMWRRSVNCYMSGEGRVWADFSFSRMARYAVEFVEDQGYPQAGLKPSAHGWIPCRGSVTPKRLTVMIATSSCTLKPEHSGCTSHLPSRSRTSISALRLIAALRTALTKLLPLTPIFLLRRRLSCRRSPRVALAGPVVLVIASDSCHSRLGRLSSVPVVVESASLCSMSPIN